MCAKEFILMKNMNPETYQDTNNTYFLYMDCKVGKVRLDEFLSKAQIFVGFQLFFMGEEIAEPEERAKPLYIHVVRVSKTLPTYAQTKN